MDRDELIAEIENQRNVMVSVATGGPKIDTVNRECIQRRRVIAAELDALGLDDPNPHTDLWAWYGKWSTDLPNWASRRSYLSEMYGPLLERLANRSRAGGPQLEPTGWQRVDRSLDKMRTALETASDEEDFQQVGLLGRETLISLAQAVFDRERHETIDGIDPSDTDADGDAGRLHRNRNGRRCERVRAKVHARIVEPRR